MLKDDVFAESYSAAKTFYYNERFYRPQHVVLPSITLYHKRKNLSRKDIDDIMEWYYNGCSLGADIFKAHKKEKWENKYGWFVTPEQIEIRDRLLDAEMEFRRKIVEEYL